MINAFENIQSEEFDATTFEHNAKLQKRAERLAQLSFAVNLVSISPYKVLETDNIIYIISNHMTCYMFNSLPTSGNFCCLLITFANSLDPNQARQNIGPDLDPNCLTL